MQNIFKLTDISSTRRRLLQGSDIKVISTTSDPLTEVVTCTVEYFTNVNNDEFQLKVDIEYLKTNHNSLYFNYTPSESVQKVSLKEYEPETLLGIYYTDDQYSTAEMIYFSAFAVSILSFISFIVGIFTKEVVGLEMAMLCQFTYLSLLYYEGTLQLPYYALKSLVYSNGFNILHSPSVSL